MPALLLQESTGGLNWSIELPPFFGLIAVIFLIFLNGFFVATEFSLVAVRRSRIEQLASEGHRTAGAVKKALDHLDTYIAATQLGITMASLALGWLGEPALAHLIDPVLEVVLPHEWAVTGSHAISVAIAFTLITALHIILGELAPKGIALQKTEATALFVIVPTTIFLRVFRPFIFVLNGTGNVLLHLVGLRTGGSEEHAHSVEELRYLVRSSREAGLLELEEEEIATRALTLGDMPVYHLMVPRTEMVSVDEDIGREALLDLAGETHFTRFPVYSENPDHVTGIIHITDALSWEREHPGEPFDVRVAAREPLFVPESARGDDLLTQMRGARSHTAIVVDEFGGVAGMVTLQDLLEGIVGDIPESDETAPPAIETLADGSVRMDGLLPLEDVLARFDLPVNNIHAETVGGYVLESLGRVPDVGEELSLPDLKLRVTAMDGPRVAEVLLIR